jgi:hypothetical protein
MDQRIEAFLADVLALAGESPDAIREGVRVALADCEAIFRAQEANKRMRDQIDGGKPALYYDRVSRSRGWTKLAPALPKLEVRRGDDLRFLDLARGPRCPELVCNRLQSDCVAGLPVLVEHTQKAEHPSS